MSAIVVIRRQQARWRRQSAAAIGNPETVDQASNILGKRQDGGRCVELISCRPGAGGHDQDDHHRLRARRLPGRAGVLLARCPAMAGPCPIRGTAGQRRSHRLALGCCPWRTSRWQDMPGDCGQAVATVELIGVAVEVPARRQRRDRQRNGRGRDHRGDLQADCQSGSLPFFVRGLLQTPPKREVVCVSSHADHVAASRHNRLLSLT